MGLPQPEHQAAIRARHKIYTYPEDIFFDNKESTRFSSKYGAATSAPNVIKLRN